MGKKLRSSGVSSHVVKANERKAAAAAHHKADEAQRKEAESGREWAAGTNSRAAAKAQQLELKRRQADERRAEKERVRRAEEEELARMKGVATTTRRSKPVRTVSVLAPKSGPTPTPKPKPKAPPLVPNLNRANADALEARSVGAAIDVLSSLTLEDDAAANIERHPERRSKAAYRAFEERMMPELKQDYPALKHSQYKQKLRLLWRKSPDNPMNQESIAYNAKTT